MYKGLYEQELNNVHAYESANSALNNQILEFKYTMDGLRSSKDSLNQKILAMVDKMKIKDKNIKYLQYQSSVIGKTDTVVIKDTIFKPIAPIDTVIGDSWYNVNLGLRYPSTIIVTPKFKSEKTVVIHTRKEYNKPPSKIFFIRWFQKKHQVVEVKVIENNPYIENKESRFIEVTKN